MGGLTNYLWGDKSEVRSGIMYGMMTTKNYQIPDVIVEIARDTSDVVIKQSNGLDLTQLVGEGYFGTDNRSMMMQWGMEAFTNPIIIRNSIAHIRQSNMFSNDFIKDFRWLDFTLLRWLQLEPTISWVINPQSNGVAIQKGNTYTFKTSEYTLYSVQNHQPGTYGDQQHVSGMNIGGITSIFHSHPAVEQGINRQSPNYWVGYGHFPHVAQERNVSLAIYDLPAMKGLMEEDLLDYTHAYFPAEKFDTAIVNANYAFGKLGDTYCVFITKNELKFRENSTDDLIQHGKKTFWITEAGSRKQDGSFANFYSRIISNRLSFDASTNTLNYASNGNALSLTFQHDFLLNGKPVVTEYPRYDSPYAKANKKDKTITYRFNGKSLHLDFENLIREF
jgi:hypothetical protein